MPLKTYPEIIRSISLINKEIDFSIKDKLSYFAKRMLNDLKEQKAAIEKDYLNSIEDLKYKYAATNEAGIVITQSPQFNEETGFVIDVEIPTTELSTFVAEVEAVKTEFEAIEIDIPVIECPECPRMYELSDDFKTEFSDTLLPTLTYEAVTFNFYSVDSSGCFYGEPNPVTVYFNVDKYYQFNNVPPGENTFAPDGCYFITNTEFKTMVDGVLSLDFTACFEG